MSVCLCVCVCVSVRECAQSFQQTSFSPGARLACINLNPPCEEVFRIHCFEIPLKVKVLPLFVV